MVGVVPYAERFAISVWIAQCSREYVRLRVKTVPVGYRQGVVNRRMTDRAPEVDDLVAFREEPWGVFDRKVAEDTGLGGVGSLVDVDALDRLALLRGVVNLTRATATDGCD